MKYSFFVCKKQNTIPVPNCGGVIVGINDQLIVDKQTAMQLLQTHSGYLVMAGTVEKQKLASGNYEYVPGGKPKVEPEPYSPDLYSANKSMAGKSKRKVK